MVYRSRQLLFIAGLVWFGIGSSAAAPNLSTAWHVDNDRSTSKAVASVLKVEGWLTASTAQPLAQSSPSSSTSSPASPASPSPSSAPLSSPSSSSIKDWMWWAVLALIPIGVLAGVLYGLQRASRKTKSSRKESRKFNDPESDRLNSTVPRSKANRFSEHSDQTSEFNASGNSSSHFESLGSKLNSSNSTSSHSESYSGTEVLPDDGRSLASSQSLSATGSQLEESPLTNTTRLAKVDIVEELIQDLHSADPGKRRKAVWELGQRGDSRAVQPLVDLLVDSDSTQRSLILAAISEIGVRTLKPLNRALMMSIQDDSADVRKNALRDVTRIFDLVTQMSQLLQYAATDPDGEVQQTAEWALTQLNRIRSLPSTESLPGLNQIRLQPPTNGDSDLRERPEDQ